MRIALTQMDQKWENKEDNLVICKSLIIEAKKYGVDFDYTYTKSYDNNTCKAGGCHRKSSELGTAKVQVPQNAFSQRTNTYQPSSLSGSFTNPF